MAAVVTLLFTDLVGSTELLDRLGDDAAESLRPTHFRILREAVASAGGEEVKNLGDGLMVVFDSAVGAVECAVAIQRAMGRHNRGRSDGRLQVRVGLHVGEPIRDEEWPRGHPGKGPTADGSSHRPIPPYSGRSPRTAGVCA